MEPNYEFRFDENGVPVAITSAFGKQLLEELPLDKMQQINEKVSEAASNFVEESTKANIRLRKALPTEGAEKVYAQAFLYYHLHLHQEETGEKVTFVDPGRISDSWVADTVNGQEILTSSEEARANHTALATKYNAYEGALREDDVNRAFLVMACENFVLHEFSKVGSRQRIKCTPTTLWEYVKEEAPFVQDEWEISILPTLVQDGWVLYNADDGSVQLLPYGSGVPGYDAELGVDHPAWARDPNLAWP